MLVRPFGPNVDSDGDWSEYVIKSDKSTAPRGAAPPRAQDSAADAAHARRREHDIDGSASSTSTLSAQVALYARTLAADKCVQVVTNAREK